MRIKKLKPLSLLLFVILLYTVYIFSGIDDYRHAKSFDEDFDYPLKIDINPIIEELLRGKKPQVSPINYYPYRFITSARKCKFGKQFDLIIVVKSALSHFSNRMAIRKTYGQELNSIAGANRILFFLGSPEKDAQHLFNQSRVADERVHYQDIIQMNFVDTYFNNTTKTMMMFRWLFEFCSKADFYLFTDDDMYISVRNLIDYVKNKEKSPGVQLTSSDQFYAGYMFKSTPRRLVFSKWRISLEEYPWDRWPPYVTAGAYVLSNASMKRLYVASLFVKHFRFDDIYLGIVAMKAGINLTHCDEFYFYKKPYSKAEYKHVIASHGYSDDKELIRVWQEQNVI